MFEQIIEDGPILGNRPIGVVGWFGVIGLHLAAALNFLIGAVIFVLGRIFGGLAPDGGVRVKLVGAAFLCAAVLEEGAAWFLRRGSRNLAGPICALVAALISLGLAILPLKFNTLDLFLVGSPAFAIWAWWDVTRSRV